VRDRIAYGETESTVGACEGGPISQHRAEHHSGETFDDNWPLTLISRSCYCDSDTLDQQFYYIRDIEEITYEWTAIMAFVKQPTRKGQRYSDFIKSSNHLGIGVNLD